MAEQRISFAARLQRLADALVHGIACASHYDDPCDCGVCTDAALCRQLAALIERAEVWNQSGGLPSEMDEELRDIMDSLAAGFSPALQPGTASDD